MQKGQGATEYLLLIAVVLVIGTLIASLVALAGTGGVPQIRKMKADAYWRSARPLSILDSTITPDGDISLVLQNREADAATLTGLTLGDAPAVAVSQTIGPGDTQTVSADAPAVPGSEGYCTYDSVALDYRLGELDLKQSSDEDLVVNCPDGGVCYPDGTQCQASSNCCASLSCVGTGWGGGPSICYSNSQCRQEGYDCQVQGDCCFLLSCNGVEGSRYCEPEGPPG